MENLESNINFDLPKNRSNVIKVIGVGGGGSNAINYMFEQGIIGVDFVITNTDSQALEKSSVPIKIQLGASLTEGLGAGANPEIGKKAAQESFDELHNLLSTQTKMVFITAGMGGGTGTGAAPIIAKMAKELDILTVGIVTMPFQFEGKIRLDQAQKGLEDLKNNVDSLIIINNNKLREVYGNLGFKAGFSKADEVLSKAARGIAEVITHHYTQNIDFKDANTVLKHSGSAIMGSASASGSNRAQDAIINALDSPLLNDNKITGCKNVLLLIVSGTEEITIDEIGEINEYIQDEAGNGANIIMGVGEDLSLGEAIAVTIIATGFNLDQQQEIVNSEVKKVIHTLEDEQSLIQDLTEKDLVKKNNSDLLKEEEQGKIFIDNNNQDLELENELVESDDKEEEVIFESKENELVESDVKNNESQQDPSQFNSINDKDLDNNSDKEQLDQNFILDDQIKDIEVSFEIEKNKIKESNSLDEEFIINDLPQEIKDIEVITSEEFLSQSENQISFEFDLSIEQLKQKENKQEIIKEKNQLNKEDFVLSDVNKEANNNIENIEDEIHLEEKVVEKNNKEIDLGDSNPFNKKINETLDKENEIRREELKKFNYSFNKNISRIEEMEKEPAYKRMGFNLEENTEKNESSQMTIDKDSNDEVQLRSNNSFLHDNVD